MRGDRHLVRAAEFCASVRDGTHDSPKPVERGRKLVTSRHLTTGRLDLSDAYQISEEDFENIIKRSKVDRWDVLISMIGTVGEPCLIKEEPEFAIKNIGLFKSRSEVDGKWLFYYLRSEQAQRHIKSHSRGTTQEYIPLGALRDFPILVPDDRKEQNIIVEILGSLDDKIELNRRMNETLEAMARALFHSWFVDFDPVRAKLDGRQPAGLDAETAALFPAAFQDSEDGRIPKGWTIEPVGQVVDCVGGGTPSTAEPKYWEGGTHHWTTPKDFSSLQAPMLFDTSRKLTDLGVAKISSGLLPAGTLLLSSRAPVGYLAIAAMPVAINQGFIAMKCNAGASNYFMLNWCKENMATIEGRATGTTFAEISKQNFRPIPVVLPPKDTMAAFTAKVAPMYAQIEANLRESRTLAALRDTLLPKLLSGELRVGA